MADTVEIDEPQGRVHTVVIDCSSFTFIDSVGLHALPSVSINILILFIMTRYQLIAILATSRSIDSQETGGF